jgi:hypothetical protein
MFDYNQYGPQHGILGPQQLLNQQGPGFWSTFLGSLSGLGVSLADPEDKNGWHHYCGNPAPPNALCLFKSGREENEGDPWIGYGRDIHREFNIANLKWKYTGIAREERGLW